MDRCARSAHQGSDADRGGGLAADLTARGRIRAVLRHAAPKRVSPRATWTLWCVSSAALVIAQLLAVARDTYAGGLLTLLDLGAGLGAALAVHSRAASTLHWSRTFLATLLLHVGASAAASDVAGGSTTVALLLGRVPGFLQSSATLGSVLTAWCGRAACDASGCSCSGRWAAPCAPSCRTA